MTTPNLPNDTALNVTIAATTNAITYNWHKTGHLADYLYQLHYYAIVLLASPS